MHDGVKLKIETAAEWFIEKMPYLDTKDAYKMALIWLNADATERFRKSNEKINNLDS